MHWTMTIAGRRHGWLNVAFHRDFQDLLRSAARRHEVAVPVYCLMPDHLHLMVAGMAATADQLLWARAFRRALNSRLAPYRLQKQAYDHVLRSDESSPDAFAALVHYICENPVRAGLISLAGSWPYLGACVASEPELDPRQPDFSERWWRLWKYSSL